MVYKRIDAKKIKVVNHKKAYNYVKKCISENTVKDLYSILTNFINQS